MLHQPRLWMFFLLLTACAVLTQAGAQDKKDVPEASAGDVVSALNWNDALADEKLKSLADQVSQKLWSSTSCLPFFINAQGDGAGRPGRRSDLSNDCQQGRFTQSLRVKHAEKVLNCGCVSDEHAPVLDTEVAQVRLSRLDDEIGQQCLRLLADQNDRRPTMQPNLEAAEERQVKQWHGLPVRRLVGIEP